MRVYSQARQEPTTNGIEPRPHWLEASALATALSTLPLEVAMWRDVFSKLGASKTLDIKGYQNIFNFLGGVEVASHTDVLRFVTRSSPRSWGETRDKPKERLRGRLGW